MLSWLATMDGAWGPLRLFGYVSVRTVGAAVTAFILMLIVMPPLIRALRRRKLGEAGSKNEGAVIVDAMREGKKGTPTMGGLGLVACAVAAALLWCDPLNLRVAILIFAIIAFAGVGYLDDRVKVFRDARGTSEKVKLTAQVLVALACGAGLYVVGLQEAQTLLPEAHPAGWEADWYKKVIFDKLSGEPNDYIVRLAGNQLAFPFVELTAQLGLWAVLWYAFVTTACANGVNFTDGMDGLAAGTVFIATLAFMVIAYVVARVDTAAYLHVPYVFRGEEVAVFCAALAGAALGFLWFNCAPAEIFMGDTGSQALGGCLGVVALNTKQEFLILLVGFVFVAEASSVAIQKLVFKATKHRPGGGIRVFRCAPVHHHFQYLGWSESKIVLRFWIVAAMAALLALATLKIR